MRRRLAQSAAAVAEQLSAPRIRKSLCLQLLLFHFLFFLQLLHAVLFLGNETLLCLVEGLPGAGSNLSIVLAGCVRHLDARTECTFFHQLVRLPLLILHSILLQPELLLLLGILHSPNCLLVHLTKPLLIIFILLILDRVPAILVDFKA